MVIRTYFDKNNTIQYNDLTNTGLNPVSELFYGGAVSDNKYSRLLFYFDESRIKELYLNGSMPDLTKMKHTLNLINTSSFDTELLNTKTSDGKDRATSFDLILFKIPQVWDEGTGYDYMKAKYIGGVENTSSLKASNWLEAQNNTYWINGNGTYSGSPEIITTIHFDKGNEHIEADITDTVNDFLSGGSINYGLGLAYTTIFEQTPTDSLQYVGFFTRHTQTFFEPYLETRYNDFIMDDRNSFYLDKVNKLYLYSNLKGEATNLDNTPTVTIRNSDGDVITATTATTHVTKGVYSVDVILESISGHTEEMIYTDTWSNISVNGITRPDIELEFVTKDDLCYYNIGSDGHTPKRYGFSISGIKKDERIVRGNTRVVNVSARIPYTVNQQEIIDKLQYRLYVKEGRAEYTVIDFTYMNRTVNSNYFTIDTASLIPNTYYIDIKAESNGEITIIKDNLNFDIVSIVKYR